MPMGRVNLPWFASSTYGTGENDENLRKNKMKALPIQFEKAWGRWKQFIYSYGMCYTISDQTLIVSAF